MVQNKRAFEVRYLQATDTKGVRLSIIDSRNEVQKIYPKRYDDTIDLDAGEFGALILKEQGIEIECKCSLKRGFALISSNFTTELK